MSKFCTMCGCNTNCNESCRDCAKEAYDDLKSISGKADYVSEEAIRNDLGDGAFELLKKYNYIECCTIIKGHKMYAI